MRMRRICAWWKPQRPSSPRSSRSTGRTGAANRKASSPSQPLSATRVARMPELREFPFGTVPMPNASGRTVEPAPSMATPTGAAHLLFLSHAGIDSEAALRLARRLEESQEAQAHGLKVWIDKGNLGAGGRWKDALQSALARSTAFAVYVGS